MIKVNSHPELQRFLAGRSLLASELPFSEKILQQHEHQIQTTPGISKGWRCNRCANTTQRLFAAFPCARCKKDCHYCRKCIMMGRVSTCTPLYSWNGPAPEWEISEPVLQWEGELSPGQEVASKAVAEAVVSHAELLVWAVCGAGKTEVLFEGVAEALSQGLRVCIATPRTDVVLELAPRLRKVFPTIQVSALYGGSEDRHTFAPLTISTTHQLLRFEKAFDVVIVDEVDAFPYSYDDSLKWAVEKSAKPRASRIYLSATPSTEWRKAPHVKIPARFHRHPLPVPEFKWCGNWRKQLEKGKVPRNVFIWAEQRIKVGKQALIFLPHIKLMEKALPLFRKLHPDIEAVHSEDPNRKEKVGSMRERKIPLLLTTTILERGVTFPNIDVAVLGAEDDTFTEAALVQISGRVGRSSDFPDGTITFFHYGRTKAMIKAITHIDGMNREARKKGLIDR